MAVEKRARTRISCRFRFLLYADMILWLWSVGLLCCACVNACFSLECMCMMFCENVLMRGMMRVCGCCSRSSPLLMSGVPSGNLLGKAT